MSSIIEKALGKGRSDKAATQADASARPSESGNRAYDAISRGEDFLADDAPAPVPADAGSTAVEAAAVHGAAARLAKVKALAASSDMHPDAPHQSRGDAAADKAAASKAGTLVRIPLDELQAKGFLTPSVPRSRIAEEFRGIKRPILRNISGKGAKPLANANLVMVTSALQGDGKTFSSINLALSIAAEQDKTVLFVDADVVRATAGKTLGVPKGTPGLIDVLDAKTNVTPADVILHTNVDKLRILPAGNASDKSTELLASDTMHGLMLELAGRYPDRVIVFDSPPLLLTSEASVLASFMGQIVFVVSADVTPQHAVQEALEHIGEDKMVGVMLNRASRRRSKLLGIGSYGYGYGYGYGYAYGADRDAGSAKKSSKKGAGK